MVEGVRVLAPAVAAGAAAVALVASTTMAVAADAARVAVPTAAAASAMGHKVQFVCGGAYMRWRACACFAHRMRATPTGVHTVRIIGGFNLLLRCYSYA
jgi:hypothetical protein